MLYGDRYICTFGKEMKGANTSRRIAHAPFEFQRNGPLPRKVGGHIPDCTLAITRPSKTNKIKNRSLMTANVPKPKTHMLDTLFIVDVLGNANFRNCREINGSSKKLNEIDIEALRELDNVKKVDFSDNSLTMEPFSVMPKLEELDLSCNGLKSFDYKKSEELAGDERAWASLKVLNLGYNSLGEHIYDLQFIPLITSINLSHNNLASLPSNLMHFTCLNFLNLTGNMLNSESAFYSLATIPSLQTLVLDDNKILRIPSFHFGFEAIQHMSLKKNKLQTADDIEALTDLEQLEDVDISDNPILLRRKELATIKKIFKMSNIVLKYGKPPPQKKQVLAGPLRTIPLDPLSLPVFTTQHIRALNQKKSPRKIVIESADAEVVGEDEAEAESEAEPEAEVKERAADEPKTSIKNMDSDIFMTAFDGSTIEPTPLPQYEEEPQINNIWTEIPVIQVENRIPLTKTNKQRFDMTFHRLEYVVSHPDLRIKPHESPTTEPPETSAPETPVNLITTRTTPTSGKDKKHISSKLAARTEYTKTEIQQMLQSMEERLSIVERDLTATDETGHSALDIALDQRNFSQLHKQYETIRAELINTLNS